MSKDYYEKKYIRFYHQRVIEQKLKKSREVFLICCLWLSSYFILKFFMYQFPFLLMKIDLIYIKRQQEIKKKFKV